MDIVSFSKARKALNHRWGYNLRHLNGLRSAFEKTNSIKHVVILGDSITEGQVAPTPWRDNGYAKRVENGLKSMFGNGGHGLVPFWANKSSSSSEISISGGNAPYEYYRQLNTNASFTYSDADGSATGVDLFYEKFTGGGKLWLSKSSTSQFVQLESATEVIGTLSISGLTPSVSNITGWVENFPGRVIGLRKRNSTLTNGVVCHNLGYTTKTGAAWLEPAVNGAKVESTLGLLAPSTTLTIIAFGANDYNTQTDVATYKASIKDAVTKALARGSKVLLVSNGLWYYEIENPKAISHFQYENALYEIADETKVALVNVNEKWRAQGKSVFMSYLGDGVIHPSDSGHADIANTILACLF